MSKRSPLGNRIRALRNARGWSQNRLAEELKEVGVRLDSSAISRIEDGSRDVSLTQAVGLTKVLGFSLDQLAGIELRPEAILPLPLEVPGIAAEIAAASARLGDALRQATEAVAP